MLNVAISAIYLAINIAGMLKKGLQSNYYVYLLTARERTYWNESLCLYVN